MRRLIIGSLLASAFLAAGATGVASQDMMRGERMRVPMMGRSEMGMMGGRWAEDAQAFMDARIAALHAGLKLSADQEKLWPPVEAAVRDFAKLRIDRANARMNAGTGDAGKDADKPEDPVARLRQRAEDMGATSTALKKIADAADPLYKTLDDGQKRRLAALTRHRGPFGGGCWRSRSIVPRLMIRLKKKSESRLRFVVPLPRICHVPSGPNQRERSPRTVTYWSAMTQRLSWANA